MTTEQLHFESVKVGRGAYVVEYAPPISGGKFASVQLVFTDSTAPLAVAEAMEQELDLWLGQYNVPVMLSSFAANGDLIHLEPTRPCSHLTGWLTPGARHAVRNWRLVKASEIPVPALTPIQLRSVYSGFKFRTSQDIARSAASHRRAMRLGWWVVFAWAAVLPAGVAFLEYFAPAWLAYSVFAFAIWKAYIKALSLLGRWPKSAEDVARDEEERAMRHHHYHCVRNPEAFQRLKAENFDREAIEEARQEAMRLNQQSTKTPA